MHAWRACGLAVGFLAAGFLSHPLRADEAKGMTISSPDFAPGQAMPRQSALAAQNMSPHLEVRGVPPKAKYLALIMDDPDSPTGLWTHWLAWNIWLNESVARFGGTALVKGARVGRNSFGNTRYDGPAPPSGTHRYFFHVYALDSGLALANGASRYELEAAMKGRVVGSAEFFGTYSANP